MMQAARTEVAAKGQGYGLPGFSRWGFPRDAAGELPPTAALMAALRVVGTRSSRRVGLVEASEWAKKNSRMS